MKHLLKLLDLTKKEILDIVMLADKLKQEKRLGVEKKTLEGKTLGMIFMKASTRTRVSFEAGMYQLGGHALFMSDRDLQIGRGEPIEDTARVLGRYLDGIMIRTFEQSQVETLAQYAGIPIINGLTDFAHPCQALADLQTIAEYKKRLDGVKLCYIGDGNNMANSLIVGGLKTGMKVSIATPSEYKPVKDIMDFAASYDDFYWTEDIYEAAKNADVVYTDVWASMGQESESEKRKKDFAGYCVDEKLMKNAKSEAIVLHCLPAHRGEEIAADTFEKYAASIFGQAENRLHAQKAVLSMLMK